MAPLRYAAKFDPFLSLDCAPTPSTLAQSKERKGSNFAIWQPWFQEHVHNKFNMYAFVFFGCEVANLVIACIAIYATHLFFNNQFLTYGTSVWR